MMKILAIFFYFENEMQIYDTPESELKLNDVFEFVGLLTFDTKLAAEDDTSNELCEDVLVHLPPSKVLIHICHFLSFGINILSIYCL